MTQTQSSPPLLQMNNIEKKFPGVVALNDVTFQVNGGEIHALLGANGAGKSTLMKVLCGVIPPDRGEILINGEMVQVTNPASAIKKGISYVPQELNLVPDISVCHNVILGQEPFINKSIGLINEKKLHQLAKQSLDFVDLDVDMDTPVKDLPISDQQMITIATALLRHSKIFIFDEPTASLSYNEINKLFEIMKKLRQDGHAIIFITHHLEEVFKIADRITVLRDAVYQGTFNLEDVTRDQIITLMTGKNCVAIKNSGATKEFKHEVLRVEGVNTQKISKDISFALHKGEILCLFGQVGSGRTDVMRAIFGVDKMESGKISLFGKLANINTPIDAINSGIGFITEDRKNQGIILSMDMVDNINMGNYEKSSRLGFIQLDKVKKVSEKYRDSLNIKNSNLKLLTKFLSGGNQQKVILAKWLNHDPKILFMDEPTKGIDVGAKQEFYQLIRDLAERGMAVLLITSELNEALGLSDRILVFCKGSIVGELKPHETTEEEVMSLTL